MVDTAHDAFVKTHKPEQHRMKPNVSYGLQLIIIILLLLFIHVVDY